MNRLPLFRKYLLWFAFLAVFAVFFWIAFGPWVTRYLGQSAWDRTKADLIARGEKLSITDFIPPAIPDRQNFFADPMWMELIEHQTLDAAGNAQWQPAIPKEQTQLYALRKPVPDPELKPLQKKFPALRAGDDRVYLASSLIIEAQKSSDARLKAEAAEAALATLEPLRPILVRVHALLDRPEAIFPIAYEKGAFAPSPHVTAIFAIASVLSSRAQAAIILHDREAALTDTFDLLRLARLIGAEPTLLSFVDRIAVTNSAWRSIHDGIAMHVWQESDLAAFQDTLDQIHFFPGLARALRGERGMGNMLFENLRRSPGTFGSVLPPGMKIAGAAYVIFFRAPDQAFYNITIQQVLDALGTGPTLETGPLDKLEAESEDEAFGLQKYARLISRALQPAFGKVIRFAAQTQDQVFMLRIACALERYRLKTGAYPTALAALVPGYLSEIPTDIVAGHTFHYRPAPSGQFQLWSIGWNGIDDHGVADKDRRIGDWPWSPPLPASR